MDQFDFSAPVNVTVIFDDSDDETFETKPSIEDLKKENVTKTNDSSKVEQDLDKQANNVLLTTISNTSETTTDVQNKLNNDRQSTVRKLASNLESITKKLNKHALKKNPLDMPSLEENSNEMLGISDVNESDKNEKTNTKNNTNLERETTKGNKKVSKRSLTEELSNSIKKEKATKLSAEKKEICKKILTKDIDPTANNNETVSFEKEAVELNPTDDNNEKQVSNNIAVYSKYFVNCNQDPSSKKTSHIESDNKNIVTVEINPSTQPIDQEQSNLDKSYQSLNEFNKTVGNYLKGLIDTVSEHILFILYSFYNYVKLCQTNTDPRLLENAKNNYLRTRNHFFDLSYSSVVNIIIPRNKEPTFVENFLTNTIQIGRSKSFNYSYDCIRLLYSEMITWVQKRQVQNMNIHKVSSSKLLQELQKPLSRSPTTHQNQSPVSRKNSTQSRRPLIKKHESPHLYEPNQQPYPTVQLQNSIAQNKPPPYSNQNQQYLESPVLNGCSFQSSRLAKQSNIGPTYLHQQDTHREHYKNQMPSTYPNQNAFQKPINYSLQQMQRQITTITPNPNYNNEVQKATLHQDPGLPQYSVKAIEQKQSPHPWQNDVLPSFAQNFQQYHQEIISTEYNNQLLQPETPMQVESNRSSISRDSGFMSPLNFNINSDVSVQEAQTTTPLITHVTSLNPNVSLIKNGNCAVCGKVTKQKCLGCFTCYYCSHSCQFLDWKIHQLVCKYKKT